ncbi:Calx-beta domain-containing protein [Petroclostridium sp. X23]|uniref:Calx-beta domain-containing protein n=1 Tax=Petroclostridium sp. X23 TaxID=3045146 RepID=UPI0024AD63E2|nr:Calx-beta domain-containing protein [Petroclostridium sp. X23]WHH59674.1 Calx-beta domain-containing protein [Petroclostridium sp. X23]
MFLTKSRYKNICIILVFTLLVQFAVPGIAYAQQETASFNDIKGHWAEQNISEFISRGFIHGYPDNVFKPDKSITRAEFVSILNRTFDVSSDMGQGSFNDVHQGDWYYKDVETAKRLAYIGGFPDGSFKPAEALSREQAAAIIYRFLNITQAIDESLSNIFGDGDNISEWAKNGVYALKEYGLISGMPDGSFLPQKSISRAEAVTILLGALRKVEGKTGIEGRLYADDLPLAGVSVRVFVPGEDQPVCEVITDGDGLFYCDVQQGEYDITAVSDQKVGYDAGINVRKGYLSLFKMNIVKGCRITGYALDGNSKALSNTTLYFRTNPVYTTVTDEDGYFSLVVPKSRKYALYYKEDGEKKEIADFEAGSEDGEINLGKVQKGKQVTAGAGGSSTASSGNDDSNDSSQPSAGGPVISSIEPGSGIFGSTVKIKGTKFGGNREDVEVTFKGSKQGEMQAGIVSVSENELEVMVPGIIQESAKVTVRVGNLQSNSKDFELMGLPEAKEQEDMAQDTLNSIKRLITATKHETEIGLAPFLDQDLSNSMKQELDTMLNDIQSSMDRLTAGKSEEELKIINDLLANPAVKSQLDEINQAAEVLSHSTITEALGNIAEAKEMLREVKNMLDNLAYVLTVARNTAVALAAASILYGDMATAATLTSIAGEINNILSLAINPAREIVAGILSILDMAPTKAVSDSLVLYAYQNDLGIDQYFENLEQNYNSREPGPFYEEKVNKLSSVVSVIQGDISNISDPEKVGTKAADLAADILQQYDVKSKLQQAMQKMNTLQQAGAAAGYTNKENTLSALKDYAGWMTDVADAVTALREKAKDKADDYANAALIESGENPLLVPALSLNKKLYLINQQEETADSENGIQANAYYQVYLSTALLLSRTLAEMDFNYFEEVPMEDLISGSWYDINDNQPGSLSEHIFVFVKKIGKITPEQVAQIEEDGVGQVEDLGCIYVTQPYFFKGHVDFTSRDNDFLNIENVLNQTGNSVDSLTGGGNMITRMITKMMMKLADDKLDDLLRVNLTDVDVALKVSFFDDDGTERKTSDIIDWQWVSGKQTVEGVEVENKLMLKAKKTGEENIMITAVLVEGEDYLEEDKEAFSIKRRIKAVSGYQTGDPYEKGPEVENITNLDMVAEGTDGSSNQGYIGDILAVDGFGFSKMTNEYQNVFFGEAPGYNETGAAKKWMQSDNDFRNFKVEIPDALTGSFIVSVGPDGGTKEKWPSNPLDFTILNPRVDYMNPTAIKGEAWPVWGRGFSHTASHNKGMWPGSAVSNVIKPPAASQPMDSFSQYDEPVNLENHYVLHPLHRRLDFVVPSSAATGAFHINTIGALNTEDHDVIVRSFSNKAVLSDEQRRGLRPSIARDNTTGKRIAVWIDQTETFGNKLAAASIGQSGKANNPVVVSDNIGGIPSAPERPSVSAGQGIYQVVWTGAVNGNDEILFSISDDGIRWSEPINISNSSNAASIQPVVRAEDIDSDGDADAVIAWTEDNGSISRVYTAVLKNNGNTFTIEKNKVLSGGSIAGDPEIAVKGAHIAFLWSEGANRNVYLQQYDDGSNQWSGVINISNNADASRYPSAVFNTNPATGEEGIAVVWENINPVSEDGRLTDYKEDIFFARVQDGTVSTPVNLTKSRVHSQRPVIANDADQNLALTWIEQGYEDQDQDRADFYASAVMFARSFNGGDEFHRPYMVLQSHHNSTRLGHPAVTADEQGYVSVMWQEASGDNSKILFTTTEGSASKPDGNIENEMQGKAMDYNVFGSILAQSDGTPLRTLGGIKEKPDYSPSGRYLAYADEGWVMEAEADGAHPIGIFSGFNDMPVEVYWSPNEEILSANFVEYGFLVFDRQGKRKDVVEEGVYNTGKVVFDNPWFEDTALTNIIITDMVEREDANGQKQDVWTVADAYTNVLDNYGQSTGRFGENGDTYAVYAPDGTKIALLKHKDNDEIYKQSVQPDFLFKGRLYIAGTHGGYQPPLTEGYTVSAPAWSPDSTKIVFVNEEDSGKYVYIVAPYKKNNSPIKLTDTVNDAVRVRFSIDGQKVYVLRENGYASIDVGSGTVQNVSGFPWAYLKLNAPGGSLVLSTESIDLNEGSSGQVSVKLLRQPAGQVIVNVTDDEQSGIKASPEQLIFDAGNWDAPQEITIEAEDDQLYEGNRNRVVGFTLESEDESFNHYINRNIYITVLEDEPAAGDVTPPQWENASITVTKKGSTRVAISWAGASDEDGIKGFKIYLDGALYGEVSDEKAVINGLQKGTTHTVKIEAVDLNGNESTTGPQTTFETESQDYFYPGDYYSAEGLEVGQGQPIEEGWTRQSIYSGLQGQGMDWCYRPSENLWSVSAPVIGNDGTLYYTGKSSLGDEGYLYAVNADGSLKWKKTFSKALEGSQAAPTLTKDGHLIYIGKEQVFCVNQSGNTLWTFTPDAAYVHSSGTPIAGDQLIAVGAAAAQDGTVYIAATNPSFKRLMLYAVKDGIKAWKYESSMYSDSAAGWNGNMVTAPAVMQDGNILFGKDIVRSTGTKDRSVEDASNLGIRTSSVISNQNRIYIAAGQYIGSAKGDLYIADGNSMEVLGSVETDHPENAGIAVAADGTAYIGSKNGVLYAVSPDGAVEWQSDADGAVIGAPIVDGEGNIYFAADQRKIYALDGSGRQKWVFDTLPAGSGPGVISSPSLGYGGRLYFTTVKGLYCIGSAASDSVAFEKDSSTFNEDAGTVDIVLSRNGDASGQRIVYVDIDSASTADSSQYGLPQTEIIFEDGETTKNITLTLQDDNQMDGYKTIILKIIKVIGGASIGNTDRTVVTITDNEQGDVLSLEKDAYTVSESEGKIDVKVVRTFGGTNPPDASVDYRTNNGTAAAGTHYEEVSGTLTFTGNEREKTISIPIIDNASYDGDKDFTITLKNEVGGAALDKVSANIQITDDDAQPSIEFAFDSMEIGEDAQTVTLYVYRTGGLNTVAGIFAEWNSVLSTAETGSDLDKFSGTYLQFEQGESQKSFTLNIIDDSEEEWGEYIVLDLMNPQNASAGSKWRMTISIKDNDKCVQAPSATAGWEGGYAYIMLGNLIPGAKVRLYKSDGTLQRDPFNVGSDTYRINSVPEGIGYYVTQEVGGIESPSSNVVDIKQ